MRPRIRVLHIASGDVWGGAETVILELLRGLSRSSSVEVGAVILNEGALAQRVRALGLDPWVIGEQGRSFLGLARQVRAIVRHESPNVLHVHRYKELVLAILSGLRWRGRVVLTVHGLEPWEQLSNRVRIGVWASLWAGWLFGARFAAVSPELEARLQRIFGRKRVRRVTNPVPDTPGGVRCPLRAQLGWTDDVKVIGFVGRLEKVKGPDLLVEIARLCDPRLRFVVMGIGTLGPELARIVAQDEQLRGRVAFLGEVVEASRYFLELDLLALTSRHEGSPIVVLEAARAGLPVIAFAVGGVPELLREAPRSWLAPAGDVNRFARAIDGFFRDPPNPAASTRWARAIRKEHGLPAVTATYEILYRDWLAR